MGLVEGDLVGDGALVVGAEGRRVELVAEDAEERHRGARLDRRDPAGLVVRDGGDVRAHRAQRVRQRRPPLDPQTLDGVGVVARPGLRRVGEQPRVEPAAAAGARLEQDLRERPPSAGRTGRRRRGCSGGRTRPGDPPAARVLNGSVIVRFMSHLMYEIGALASTSDRTPKRWSTISGPRHVEDELLAALRPRPAGDADRPVRVRLEQPALLADHLGLDPQTEPDAERLDLGRQAVETVGQLAPVDEPVPERGGCRYRARRTSRHRARTARLPRSRAAVAISSSFASSKAK